MTLPLNSNCLDPLLKHAPFPHHQLSSVCSVNPWLTVKPPKSINQMAQLCGHLYFLVEKNLEKNKEPPANISNDVYFINREFKI